MDQPTIDELMRSGKWDDALVACRAFLQVQPTNARIHAYEGLCLFQRHDWKAAAESFTKATALQPDFWQAGAKLSQCLERMRQYDQALEVAQEFARLQPNDMTLQGLIRYLTPLVHSRVEGWERTAHLGYAVTFAGEGREEEDN